MEKLSKYSMREVINKRPIILRIRPAAPMGILDDIMKRWGAWLEIEDEELVEISQDHGYPVCVRLQA